MFALIEPLPGTVKSVTLKVQKIISVSRARKQRSMRAEAHLEQQNFMEIVLHLHVEWPLGGPAAPENPAYRGCFCHVSNLRAGA